MVKLCLDFVDVILASIFQQTSHTAHSSVSIIWMDLQYLFIYLYITGKVSWNNYFMVFVWIFIASIIAVLGALCVLFGLVFALFSQGKKMVVQSVLMFLLSSMAIIFLVWECIIGANNDYDKNVNYMLLTCVILYTLTNAGQTILFWRGLNYFDKIE